MSFYHIKGNHRIATGKTAFAQGERVLRPGQIVQGQILKLFPENKAEIKLGLQKMVAQLEASLTIGGKYHFQVQATDDLIHLKVIGDPFTNHPTEDAMRLLQHLGLKATKQNMSFIQTLFAEKIPFEKSELLKAFQLLDSAKNKGQARQVLKYMIAADLPLNNAVFQALSVKMTSSISEQMQQLLRLLEMETNQTPLQHSLVNRLNAMVEPPLTAIESIIKQIMSEAATNNKQLYNTFKMSGIVDANTDFSTWKKQWETFIKQHDFSQANEKNARFSTVESPLRMNETTILRVLENVKNNQVMVHKQARDILNQFAEIINNAVVKGEQLTAAGFKHLQKVTVDNLIPVLTIEQQQQIMKVLENNPSSLRQFLNVLQLMSSSGHDVNIKQLLNKISENRGLLHTNPKSEFLNQVHQTLLYTGMDHERQIINDTIQQRPPTIKSLLLQLMQQSDGNIQDRAQHLVHLINGAQLQSVQETHNFIYANLQIPGGKLGLQGDIDLEFEGAKKENGEINTDYCRILFYLDLTNLKQTVIDMNVQKRAVSVTVYNDSDNLKRQAFSLQPALKAGLEKLNYTLSSVAFKSLTDENKPKSDTIKNISKTAYQGVDYRI